MADYLISGWYALQNLRDILAQLAQLAAAVRACIFDGQMRVHFTRQMFRQWPPNWLDLRWCAYLCGCCDALGSLRLQFFELQFQLLDLTADLLALGAEDHPPQLGNDQLQMLDLVVAAEELLLLSGQLFVPGKNLLLLRSNQCLQSYTVQSTQISRSSKGRSHRGEYATDGA